jgi:TolB-like protein/Flp pilus assembly protein TadD
MSFFAELKRRSVYRVAALYVVVSWLTLQVVDVTLSLLPLPEWTGQLVFVLLAIGFPIALILAWAFELTPEGLKRDRDSVGEHAPLPGRRNKLDFVILGLLIVALGYFASQHDWSGDADGVAPGEIRSIAVLPFENLMNDPDQAFFVAGMQEALITELSKIDALRVISRTTAMRYQGAGKSVPEIAQELDVEAVVEGSVLRAGDVVRITVQLIAAESDQNLWAENFDRQLSDILVLYSEVTSEIASQIRVTLSDDERADIAASSQVDPAVYELYLKGRYLCENWSPDEMAQGTQLLQQAVSLDPKNAAAHAQLAVCLQYAAFFGYERPLDVFDRSRAAAAMAVDLDDSLADAHVALAGVIYYLDFDPQGALAALERALALDPTSIKALLHLSWLLGESGRFQEALEYNRRAIKLDPLSTVVNHAMGQVHYLNRDYDRAIVEYEKALALDRSDPSLHFSIGWAREQQGRFDEAIAAHKRAVELSSGATLYRASLGYSYALAGMQDEAREILNKLMQDQGVSPYEIAIVQLGLGEHELAIDWLEKAYEVRDSHLIYINRGPRFDPLRGNRRFIELLKRIDWPPGDGPLPGSA